MTLEKIRFFVAIALVACSVPLLAACSGGEQGASERRHIANNFTELVDMALKDPTLHEFDKDVLQRAKVSGRIEQADYDEAYSRFAQCMASASKPVELSKLSNGLYRVENTPLADGESVQSAMSITIKCQEGTINEIGELFGIQQGNPELLANADEVAYKCLAAKGIFDSSFSQEELEKALNEPGGDNSSVEDRLPFDPYGEEAQACFIGANIVLGKGTEEACQIRPGCHTCLLAPRVRPWPSSPCLERRPSARPARYARLMKQLPLLSS
ncbi:hypothetical protein AB0N65_15815 [Paenarthrobacter sp. NPDC089322]|uniref:hypothetical protein n=1 Tax=Paenarthrobacter sp. NPDC089322 TaxID=3155065 RepID=UPI003440A40C